MDAERTDNEALAKLRAPFAPEHIDKLPRGVKDGPASKCAVCSGFHKPASVHLDYVGHGRVTDRLLAVDPEWNWRPLAYDEQGMPVFQIDAKGAPMGLWITLTICGVTRIGFGEYPAAKGPDGIKEAIGDAIRNAAMRFGVALDLWIKGEREGQTPEPARKSKGSKSKGSKSKAEPEPDDGPRVTEEQRVAILAALGERHIPLAEVLEKGGWSELDQVPAERGARMIAWIEAQEAREATEDPGWPETKPEQQGLDATASAEDIDAIVQAAADTGVELSAILRGEGVAAPEGILAARVPAILARLAKVVEQKAAVR